MLIIPISCCCHFERTRHPLAKSKKLTPEEIRTEAEGYYEQWMTNADAYQASVSFLIERGNLKQAAFLLHQTVEALYHCTLLVLTLYSPKLHRITVLRSQAENLDPRLQDIWPSDSRLHRQAFDRLRRAYVEASYSAEYVITDEELAWLVERVKLLHEAVMVVCQDRLNPPHLAD